MQGATSVISRDLIIVIPISNNITLFLLLLLLRPVPLFFLLFFVSLCRLHRATVMEICFACFSFTAVYRGASCLFVVTIKNDVTSLTKPHLFRPLI